MEINICAFVLIYSQPLNNMGLNYLCVCVCVCVLVDQLCPTLYDPHGL